MNLSKVAILDCGAQYTKVIDRKIRELEVCTDIIDLETPASEIVDKGYKAIIISGGPGSITDDKARVADNSIYSSGIPILGICYGLQLLAHHFDGTVIKNDVREDGQYDIKIDNSCLLFKGLQSTEKVLLTHADYIQSIGQDFKTVATSFNKITAVANENLKIYGVQFHPEVDLTPCGKAIFSNFLFTIANIQPSFKINSRIDSSIQHIREKVGTKKVLMLMSGGVDSAVCCALLHKALGKEQVIAVHIDNGFMRKNESEKVIKALEDIGLNVRLINAQLRFSTGSTTHRVVVEGDQFRNVPIGPLNQSVVNPEEKRKIIGDVFMHIVQDLWQELSTGNINDIFLGQGTLRPDLIESASKTVSKKADAIKTHHNDTELVRLLRDEGRVIEPLSEYHKDEVRQIGLELKLPSEIVFRQPFPGPGLAVRILCAQDAYCEKDFAETSSIIKIIASYNSMSQKPHSLLSRIKNGTTEAEQERLMEITSLNSITGFLLPIQSVGVQGDCRTYSYPCVLSTGPPSTSSPNATGAGGGMVNSDSTKHQPDWQALHFLAKLIPRICHSINRVVYAFGDQIQHSVHDVTVTYLRDPIIEVLREADHRATQILLRNQTASQIGQYKKISQMPVVLIPIHFDRDPGLVVPIPSVLRSVVLRPFITEDFMTGLPAVPGQDISEDVVNKMVSAVKEVPGISRVLYDLTSKPPGTTEWE